jgi:hypothetical protein
VKVQVGLLPSAELAVASHASRFVQQVVEQISAPRLVSCASRKTRFLSTSMAFMEGPRTGLASQRFIWCAPLITFSRCGSCSPASHLVRGYQLYNRTKCVERWRIRHVGAFLALIHEPPIGSTKYGLAKPNENSKFIHSEFVLGRSLPLCLLRFANCSSSHRSTVEFGQSHTLAPQVPAIWSHAKFFGS